MNELHVTMNLAKRLNYVVCTQNEHHKKIINILKVLSDKNNVERN